MIYKIFNSKIMWVIYFIMPIILLSAIAEPSPIGALNRILSEKDGWMVIPMMLVICGVSFAFCKAYVVDMIILKRTNKTKYEKKQNESKIKEEKFWDFMWCTLPGTIILIILFSGISYMEFTEGNYFLMILFVAGDLMAISNFIHISVQK